VSSSDRPVLVVNQHTVPVFVDVVNAFSVSGPVTLFTGFIEVGKRPLASSIRIVHSKTYHRRSSFTRLASWLIFSSHYLLFLLLVKRPSAILAVSNPPLAPVITSWIARWRGIPYYVLIYDLYPEALEQAGFTRSDHWFYKRWKKINPFVFGGARKVFTLSDSMKKAVASYLPGREAMIKVIHNWVDNSYIKPIDKANNPFVKAHNLSGKLVILYAGNMGLTHDLESLLDASALLKENDSIRFVLIGEGGKKEKLVRMKEHKSLDNVMFVPYQDAETFPYAMAAADVGVITLGSGAEGISVPSKTYIAMAAGLCLLAIAPVDSELTRLITVHEIGIALEPGMPESLKEQITFLYRNPDVLERFRKTSRECSALFSPDNAYQYVHEMSMQ
jgi:glycosyltransferase involved in cell wall biosynthesis